MPYDVDEKTEQALEALIDKHGLSNVLDSLVDICNGKAEHLRANWQDETLAQAWTRAAGRIERVKDNVIRHL